MTTEKRPRGRPSVENPASETLPRVRVTPDQLERYHKAAKKKDVTFSRWIKDTLDKAAK